MVRWTSRLAAVAAVAAAIGLPGRAVCADRRGTDERGKRQAAEQGLDEAVERAHRELWRRFIDPAWQTFYNHAGIDGAVILPTAEECRVNKPNALSWDISISDGAMFGGLYMEAAIHRWMLTNQPEDREK
ncbi:MAG: hypothetical protein PHO07_21325, partial [Pirellulales bacterium]|nr:hypothetical protein [Pirellulales bacterium]